MVSYTLTHFKQEHTPSSSSQPGPQLISEITLFQSMRLNKQPSMIQMERMYTTTQQFM